MVVGSEVIRRSREVSRRIYYTVMLNSSRGILDFVGLSGLATFLLISLIPTPFTLSAGILAFSTIYVIIPLWVTRSTIPLVRFINGNSIISRRYPLIVKLGGVLTLLTLYVVFLLSFLNHSLSTLPAILVGAFLLLNGFQLIWVVKFLRVNPVEYLLVVAYMISGVAFVLSPFRPMFLLAPPMLALLYRLVRGVGGWS